ncbi:hypothetical protein [Petrachloros mirabilis]
MRPRGTQANVGAPLRVYWTHGGSYNLAMSSRSPRTALFPCTLLFSLFMFSGPLSAAADELQIDIANRGLGQEVVITQGDREWFMMIEVTPENTVIIKQEKDHDQYLVDESETHDRPLAPSEVEGAINDYVNSVKTRASKP